MITASNTLRALIIYAVVLPLALMIGYLLAKPLDTIAYATLSVLLLVIAAPLVLKWHHPMLFLSWNMSAVVFFLPGSPELWMVVAALSLVVSALQRTIISDMRFI